MKGNFRKGWSNTKDLAMRQWTSEQPRGELLDEYAGREEMTKFPVAFDKGLGDVLDKLEKLYKSKEIGDTAEKRRKLAAEANDIVDTYRQRVTQQKAGLDVAPNSRVSAVLLVGLGEVEKQIRAAEHLVQKTVKETLVGLKKAHDGWKKAKKSAEADHKGYAKDKAVAAELKKVGLLKWPFTFAEGLGPALDKLFKDAAEAKLTAAGVNKVQTVVASYQEAITDKVEAYEKALRDGGVIWDGRGPLGGLLAALAQVEKALEAVH